jgi:hypothetical protein
LIILAAIAGALFLLAQLIPSAARPQIGPATPQPTVGGLGRSAAQPDVTLVRMAG